VIRWRWLWRRDVDGETGDSGRAAPRTRPTSRAPLSAAPFSLPASRAPHSATRPPAVPPEVLEEVKLLELRARGVVDRLFAGEYRHVFNGRVMEFSAVREYQPRDELGSRG